jgi:hypothetical protein
MFKKRERSKRRKGKLKSDISRFIQICSVFFKLAEVHESSFSVRTIGGINMRARECLMDQGLPSK